MQTGRPSGSSPQIVLFDLGGVLVDFAGFGELSHHLPEPAPAAALRDRWIHDPSVAAFERGRIAEEAFGEQFVRDWQLDLSPSQFLQLFNAWFRGLYPGAEQLLASLRVHQPQLRLGCLSNSNAVHWKKFKADGTRLFDQCFLSFELGAVKPDDELFARVLEKVATPAEAVLFFDDTPVNVTAARRHGLASHCVQGLDDLTRKLQEMSLLPAAGQSRAEP